MPGIIRHTKPAAPMATAESRLKRIESQRFTTNDEELTDIQEQVSQVIPPVTSPYPIVKVSILHELSQAQIWLNGDREAGSKMRP